MLCIYELGLITANDSTVILPLSLSKSRLCVFSSHIYVPECNKILAEPLSLLL